MRRIVILHAAAILAGGALLPTGPACAQDSSPTPVRFHALVVSGYEHMPELTGWRNTAAVIRKTTGLTPGREAVAPRAVGTPDAVRSFLGGLPVGESAVVYLAAHQGPDGYWEFPGKHRESWPALLEGVRGGDAPRIFIMDVCHAGAVAGHPVWKRVGPGGFLLASTAAEKTWELNLSSPRPLDFKARFPRETAWLRRELGPEWDGRLSFLGFVWLQSWLEDPQLPATTSAWEARVRRMAVLARTLQPRRSPDFRSTLDWRALP